MEALKQLWRYASFRAAVTTLIQLSKDSLMQLAAIDAVSELEREDRLRLGVESEAPFFALETIRDIELQEELEPSAVVDALAALLDEEDAQVLASKRDSIVSAFTVSESLIRSTHTGEVEASVFPLLSSSTIQLDMRGSADPITDESGFVPIFSIRLAFDEVISGSHAVSFQGSPATITELRDRLTRAIKDLDDTDVSIEGPLFR